MRHAGPASLRHAAALALALTLSGRAQAQGWAKTGGGAARDWAQAVAAMPDGGFVVAGRSDSMVGAWIVRFDAAGDVAWQRLVLPMNDMFPILAVATPDGGCLLAATVDSAPGMQLPWLARFSAVGDLEWQRAYDLGRPAWPLAIAPRSDGLVMAGSGIGRQWVMIIDASGRLARCTEIAGTGFSVTFVPDSVAATPSGGIVVSGAFSGGGAVVELDASGGVVAKTALTFTCPTVETMSIAALPGGNWVVGGSQSCNGDRGVTAFVARLDASLAPGVALALRSGDGDGPIVDGIATAPGGFVGVGSTGSSARALLVKVDAALSLQFQRALAGAGASLSSVALLADGTLAAVGEWHGDFLVARTDADGRVATTCGSLDAAAFESSRTSAVASPLDVTTRAMPATSMAWNAVATYSAELFSDVGDDGERDSCDEPVLLEPGAALRRDFCGDSEDWFELLACTNSLYTIDTSSLEALTDTVVDVLTSDCSTLLASDDDGGGGASSSLLWLAPADGSYRVRVRQKDGTTGSDRGYVVGASLMGSPCATWIRALESGLGINPEAIGVRSDGSIVVGARHVDDEPGSGQDPIVVTLERNGTVRQVEKLLGVDDRVIASVARLSSGGTVVVGWSTSGGTDGFLRTTDASGHLLWESACYGIGDVKAVAGLRDGGLVAVGDRHAGGIAGGVLRLDAVGHRAWSVRITLPSGGYLLPRDVLELPDGALAMVSSATREPGPAVTILEADGALRSHRSYNAFPEPSLAAAPDGGLFIGGESVIARLSPGGGVAWSYGYRSSTGDVPYFHAMEATEDGGLVAVGSLRNRASGRTEPIVAKLDATGANGWSRSFDGSGALVALASAPDGGFAACGQAQIDGSYAGLVVELDASGELRSSCLSPPSPLVAMPAIVDEFDVTPDLVAVEAVLTPYSSVVEERLVHADGVCAGSGSAPPGEVSPTGSPEPLVFEGHSTLRWAPAWRSGSSTFNLYRGDVRDLRMNHHGSCLAPDLAVNTAVDLLEPAVGECWFYLVTGENGAGEGTMGFASNGVERVNAAPCP